MNRQILSLIFALDVFCVVLLVASIASKEKLLMQKRLGRLFSRNQTDEAEKRRLEDQKKKKSDGKPVKAFDKIENELISAGLLIKPSEYLLGWCLAAFGPSLLLLLLTGNIIVTCGALAIGLILPPYFLHSKKVKRVELFEKQLIEGIAIVCNSLKSGLTLQQAMASISKEMPEPISREFGRAIREINLGSTMERALTNMAERMKSQNFMMIVSAILIQRQIGGNLSDILTNISVTIRERFKIKSEIKVLTTTGRTSGRVVGMLPVFILLFFMLVNPGYVQGFFDTTVGIVMLCTATALETIGFLTIRRIVNIKY